MTRTKNRLISSSGLARNTSQTLVCQTLVQDICNKKHNYYYKTRSVSKALALANSSSNLISNPNPNPNSNPNLIKNHKYIPNLKNSVSNIRKTINIKNLKIEIPTNIY